MRITALGMAFLLLVLTGCVNRDAPGGGMRALDTRPTSTPEAFAAEAEKLAGVESLERTDGTTYELVLDPSAGAAELGATADSLFALVNEHNYGDSTPQVTVRSGHFSGDIGIVRYGAPQGVPQPSMLELASLPFLHSLPDVESGQLGENGGATVEIAESADLRSWLEASGQSGHRTRLTVRQDRVHRTDADDDHTSSSDDEDGDADEAEPTSIKVELAGPDFQDEVARLFDAAEQIPADLLSADLTSTTGPKASIAVPTDEDIRDAHAVLARSYGTENLDGFSATSAEGMQTYFGEGDSDAVFTAREHLAGVGVILTSASLDRTSITAEAPDGQALRRLSAITQAQDWPLQPDARMSVRHQENARDTSTLDVSRWPQHADLLAGLWATGDHLVFWSNADGKAKDPSMSLHGAERRPSGWAAVFLDAWDATAG